VAALAVAGLLLALPTVSAAAPQAYVGNSGGSSVSVIDTATNQEVGSPIPVGLGPFGIAITPDARTAYVSNIDTGLVKAVDLGSRQVVGPPIGVGGGPQGIAVTPDGSRAYVATNGGDQVALIDTATNFVGPPVPVGDEPEFVAIAPNGDAAYVTNLISNTVSVIDTRTNQVTGLPIDVGMFPRGIAITPDGSRAYVANGGSNTVSVIDTATNRVVGAPIEVGREPYAVAITPDGSRAYVTNAETATVSVIDTATNRVVGSQIPVTSAPQAIAITPDGSRAYVPNQISNIVSVIDTHANQVIGEPIKVGSHPLSIAITPDQAPVAAFTSPVGRPGVPVTFNGTASHDPDGTVAHYDWYFGDLQASADAGPVPRHVFAKPGRYPVTLTVTDNEGCSKSPIFTGQTAYCRGSSAASMTEVVTVSYPAVRVRCPKRAGPGGCRFKLTAVTKRRGGRAMTAVARGSAKAGRSALIALKPKPRYRARLAGAGRVLVSETRRVGGFSRTRLVSLRIAPPTG
jgi:YVTN family beta-propeller protein